MRKSTAIKARRRSKRVPINPHLKDVVRSIRSTIGAVFVFSFFLNLLALTVPIYLLQIYDKVLPNKNFDTLTFLTGIVLLAVLTFGLLESVRRTLLRKLGVRFDNEVSDHLLSSSIHRAIKKSNASVGVMRDLSSFRRFLSGSSMFPLLDAPWTPMFILILYLLHPLLGLVGIVGCILLLGLAVLNEFITRDGVKENSTQAKERLESARSYIQNADVVQAMGMQKTILDTWTESNSKILADGYKVDRVNTRLQTISKMLKLTLLVAVVFVAAWLILKEELTAGATIASLLLLRRAIAPLEQSIRSWKSVIKARSSFRNISEYLDHSSSLQENTSMPVPSGKLVLEKVSYRRPGEGRSIISGLDLTLEPGKITVITGETASGKSTLIRLLAGIVQPTLGKISLDGYELAQWSSEQLGPYLGYLPQDTGLFPGTVAFNIGRLQEQPIEQVIEAAKKARVHEMIQQLPNGYDTIIEEGGVNLSGGQRQKIGFARALFGNPQILLLDEPDASLDPDGRSALRKALRSLRNENVSVLVISHHSGIRKLADNHYRMKNRKLELDLPRLTDQSVEKTEGTAKNKEVLKKADSGKATVSMFDLLKNQNISKQKADDIVRTDLDVQKSKDQRLKMKNKLK